MKFEDKKTKQEKKEQHQKNKEITLEDIYNEFWEFIDDDNLEFKKFIINDPRRREFTIKKNG
ncbi:MAG: hypothetical protein EU532_14190 [Promethearchaeota archaeon]|nr:MAG: hypothetical protein EU532_14190 [Candidatus Lokiarchaeota archaeon]